MTVLPLDVDIDRTERVPPVGVKFHEYANLFPWLEGAAFDELKADIARNGVLEPIVFIGDTILDGRNRYMAARALGIEYPRVEYRGDNPLAFVISKNLARRHLAEGQRAMVARRIANMQQGARTDLPAIEGKSVSQAEAADMLNVSVASVERASTVLQQGAPELIAAVDAGAVSVSTAADVARLPEPEQREIVAKGEREILEAAKRIRSDRADKSRSVRLEKIEEISAGNEGLDTTRRYPIIYADPPWRYELPAMGGTNRSIENHYPTMTLDEICALPVGQIAAEDSLLYLWATAPKLPECLKVIEAWGFEYRTHIVWVKDKIGMGYHARNQHELLLIAKRGEMPPPRPGEQPSSVIEAPRGEHSAKPVVFAETIERLYPEVGKIELFCRSPRLGWSVWGNQAGGERDAA